MPGYDNPQFEVAELTAAINLLPNKPGRIGQLGIFPDDRGVRTTTVRIKLKNGSLTILSAKERGEDGDRSDNSKQVVKHVGIPHFPHPGEILPDEYQNLQAFGSESELEQLSQVMNDKLAGLLDNHDVTIEWCRMGALKGIVTDGSGNVLENFYTLFGITQKIITFTFSDEAFDVRKTCLDLKRHIEKNLKGDVMDGVRSLVSSEFFDGLTGHPTVKEAFANWEAAQDRLGGDMRSGFKFGGIIWEEYNASVDQGGETKRFIDANKGHAFPEGTRNTFDQVNAPADFVETANTIGLPVYAKQKERDFGRGIDLHSQSNRMPLCRQPAALVQVEAN